MRSMVKISMIGLWLIAGHVIYGQSIELRPMVSYTLGESFPVNGGKIALRGSESLGLSAGMIIRKGLDINLNYQLQSTTADITTVLGNDRNVPVTISYLQMGLNKNILLNDEDIIPYVGGRLGVALVSERSKRYDNTIKLSAGLTAGCKFMFNEKIGLNLFTLLQSPIQGSGVFLPAGNDGVVTSISTYTYIVQLSFGAGIVVKVK